MKDNTLVKGAAILVIFGIIGKAIGALYRIPLAQILGGEGMGMYQLVFPLYCLILTISTSGIPVAISKLVAGCNAEKRFNDARRILWISVFALIILSLLGSLVVIFGAKTIAGFQGNVNNYVSYYAIVPAIIFASLMSAFRGYFQGNLMMFPTAISELIEQIIKTIFGLFFASRLISYGVEYAVFGAILGVSISEFFACLSVVIFYFIDSKKHKILVSNEKTPVKLLSKQLVSIAVPITFGGMITPITAMIDSFFVINILVSLGYSNSVATMMLGIDSGVVEPLVNLPVMISVAIGAVMLPSLSTFESQNDKASIKNITGKCYQITLSISIVCAICFIIFGKQILQFLYGSSFDENEILLATKLLMVASFNIIFLSFVHITTSILQGLGYAKFTLKTLFCGCAIKVLLNFLLLRIPSVNILGSVIADGCCYLFIIILNYKKVKALTGAGIADSYFYVSIQACFVCLFAFFVNETMKMLIGETFSMFVSGIVAILIFCITYFVFFIEKKDNTKFDKNSI